MTDEQIIKALECCKNGDCKNCTFDECTTGLLDEGIALSLIKRQKAEIERLQKAIAVIDVMEEQHRYSLQKTKAEAIKEVFEKLEERLFVHSFKTKSEDYTQGQVDCMDFVDSKIEELKKEMEGNNND